MKIKKNKLKNIVSGLLCVPLVLTASVGCEKTPKAKEYEKQEFVLSGFWMPYEVTEEAFSLYKNAGLNTLLMVNHGGNDWSSEGRTYLGSEKTMKSLEVCRKVGLNASIHYGAWYYSRVEGKQMSDTPFSDYDLYGEYKDIITGVEIADEPDAAEMQIFGNDLLTADYKSVYSVPYMVNLYPNYASKSVLGAESYDEYLEIFAQEILEDFPNNPFVSVDYYPFRKSGFSQGWLSCYESVAKLAQRYDAITHFYMQSATDNEFAVSLTEADMRLQVYVALCYGGSRISYYCYSMPGALTDEPMYEKCLLDKDGKPTDLYYIVQEINREIQSFAPAFLAYDWVKTMGISGEGRPVNKALAKIKETVDFTDRKYVSNVTTARECLVGCFEREEDEAYMLVNWGDPDATPKTTVSVELKGGAEYVAVYGGKNAEKPVILKAEDQRVEIELRSGEGKFIVPLL